MSVTEHVRGHSLDSGEKILCYALSPVFSHSAVLRITSVLRVSCVLLFPLTLPELLLKQLLKLVVSDPAVCRETRIIRAIDIELLWRQICACLSPLSP